MPWTWAVSPLPLSAAMHELTLAAGILEIVQHNVPAADAARVRAVRVRVGELAGVVPDSLAFCFAAIVADTPYESAVLEIDRVPADATCRECGYVTGLSASQFVCPACGALGLAIGRGEELQVVHVELDDAMEKAS